ncbi:DNA-directed RNA polymerase subunit A' [Candidatus Woesearchaeota archaeon CG10_big_fil_rev_8_21_14_0_10_37_12]|nr:MAG: DNA-directed RNA polymerase subunit A' [Candidatus Woesearchaeota archaeon CG10_big_fil_rev_8_21_14_0_10_37_12]
MESMTHYVYKQVSSVVFGVLSPKMIKKMASAKIVTPELYDKEGYPVDGGLMDVRLGVIDPGLRCKTCGAKLKECIGHFGYIELARPVVHVKFVSVILDLLRATCPETGRLLIAPEKLAKAKGHLDKIEEEEGQAERRKAVKALVAQSCRGGKNPFTGNKLEKVSIEKPTGFVEGDRRLSPIEVRARLEKIPDEDLEIFGLNPNTARPEWMILTVLPIPPVTVRPSITLESGERSEDDLTHKLGDIVRINQRLFENINAGAPEIIIEDLWDLLQYHVTTFFDNDVAQLPPARHRSGQPLKTISERIKSKEGRIRHNLAGKRTNFCARTVISPDPYLALDEVGVPKIIAMKLSVPETVNDWNMEYLKKFVQRGPQEYPGANYVVRPDGKKKRITEETKEAALEELQPGYVVERHLMDGDIAIFNRQPSLHRMSMMCHRVRVLPGRTLRLNPAVCNPYNADFDGDEMNLHIPQTEESRAEAEILMQVQTQLISPRYGLSVIGCIHDAITGNYLLSKKDDLTPQQAMLLLAAVGITDLLKVAGKKKISGKEVFSMLLPEDFNYKGVSRSGDPVVIKDGKLIEGTVDTKAIGGEGEGRLLRLLHKQYGPARTIKILHQIANLGIEYLMLSGFTTGIADEDLPKEATNQIDDLLHKAEEDVALLIKQFKEGSLEAFPGRSVAETLEMKILERLNKARNECGKVIRQFITDKNNAAVMMFSGSRGSITSLIQMSACVGQQALRGKRIDKGYSGRTLSCFKKGDLSPESRGFILNSLKKGINPKEFFFFAMTGRDSLMDTALRTPKSGYLYRRLANALQDLKVEYDGTVRDASGRIIQFAYGEDGVDVSRSENGKIDVKRIVELE